METPILPSSVVTPSTQTFPGYSSVIPPIAPVRNNTWAEEQQKDISRFQEQPKAVPRSLELDPLEIDNMLQLIVSQYDRLAHQIMFRPFPFPVGSGLVGRAKISSVVRWSMYLGARIMQALLDDTNWQGYIGWIDNFHRRISTTQSALVEVDISNLADRLKALEDLAFHAFMVLNSTAGYTLLRRSTPIFLQLAAKFPHIWVDNSAISIHHALLVRRHEIVKFVFTDTIAALAFGVVPLLHYDTVIHMVDKQLIMPRLLEWVYACPVIIIILLAKINASRISRLVNWDTVSSNELVVVQEIEMHLRDWNPQMDHLDRPSDMVARLAVQECWRQAVLIYLYMGMCGAKSNDERVEPLVKQIVQLASTVEARTLETHLFIPCLIAGAAARKEKHRAVVRKKVQASRDVYACLLRGADFVFVLDHLWHGAAAGGAPTIWEDYVNSRCVALPLEI